MYVTRTGQDVKGMTMVELLVATAILSLIIIVALQGFIQLAVLRSTIESAMGLQQVFTSVSSMLNRPETCTVTLGLGLPINPGLTAPINLLNSDGAIFLYGNPNPTQNRFNSTWQIISVKLQPLEQSPSIDANYNKLVALVVVTAQLANGTSLVTSNRLINIRLTTANKLDSCSLTDSETAKPIDLPKCDSSSPASKRLMFEPPGPGLSPQWTCKDP